MCYVRDVRETCLGRETVWYSSVDGYIMMLLLLFHCRSILCSTDRADGAIWSVEKNERRLTYSVT
jgi:hypothetical protein